MAAEMAAQPEVLAQVIARAPAEAAAVRAMAPDPLAGVVFLARGSSDNAAVFGRYLVELCRPSQITVGPFLRGFYFSGVRPIMVNEVAPAGPAAPAREWETSADLLR